MLTVCSVNVGDKYPPEYIYKLHSMVQRHLSIPHRFVVFTDDVNKFPDAEFDVEKELSGYPGWWCKIGLFNKANGLTGRVLYLDDDLILVRNIDHLIHPKGFWIIDDWLGPEYNSSVMLFTAEDSHDIYNAFSWRDMGVFKTDQHFITKHRPSAQFFDPGQVVSYKVDKCENGYSDEARVIVFHGYPKPHDVLHVDWVQREWR